MADSMHGASLTELRPLPMQSCLIVDDAELIRKVAAQFVEQAGFMVTEAEDGKQALQACAANMPDLILLDWRLPVMGAVEFLNELRRIRPGAPPQILYMMTEFDIADLTEAHAAGITDFILKPFDRQTLTAKLDLFSEARQAVS
jgi:two-component system chemotaxis response regulator CheY